MTFTPDEREPKLPKWAQELLAEERRKRADYERKLAQHKATVEPSLIWYGDYDNPIYVPPNYGHQRFHMSMNGEVDPYLHDEIQVSLKDDELEISGGRGLLVKPQVSNVIKIRLDRS
ncbi:hypothetical protein SEA_PHARAOH_73 [Mycobacterium phage Pharaoh]|uniref:Uncharacterized protein n=1 Tax=Mycobacterium phage Pharaoh TaxID=2530140 RepID=A0A481W367_9CAUD|nr:hypothetical protein KIV59_gp17 [Mycobacterium phage Pharaoh]QBJ00261.1 hypothetical protein SEA_PHARAOH_73 [Mycobacterium phage Pharaoh]